MHPIIPFVALSWIIAFSIVVIIQNGAAVALGSLPYPEGSPTIAAAALCLTVAVETFICVSCWR